jgi:hypothetical protein
MTAEDRDDNPDTPAKKPYQRPKLEVYGDIHELAASSGFMGMIDGGHGFRRRSG